VSSGRTVESTRTLASQRADGGRFVGRHCVETRKSQPLPKGSLDTFKSSSTKTRDSVLTNREGPSTVVEMADSCGARANARFDEIEGTFHRTGFDDSERDSGSVESVEGPETNTSATEISPSPTIKTASD